MLRIFISQITDLHIYSLNIYEKLSGKTATQLHMRSAYTSYLHVHMATYTDGKDEKPHNVSAD